MKIKVIYVEDSESKEIEGINTQTGCHLIVCNYGLGNCVSTEFYGDSNFFTHEQYIKSLGKSESEIEVPDCNTY
jgi:hypothetical protein